MTPGSFAPTTASPLTTTPVRQSDSRQLLDQLLEGCQIIGPDWRYVYINDAALAHARRPRHELIGVTMMDAYPGIENTVMFGTLQDCAARRASARILNEFAYEDGTTAWFELRVQPVDEGLFVMSLDVTAHKQAEATLRRQLSKLDALRNIDLAILNSTDLRVTLRTVIHEVREQLRVDGALIATFNTHTNRLELTSHGGFPLPPTSGLSTQLGSGLIGRAAAERRTIAAPVLAKAERPGSTEWFSAGARTGSAYATPLIAKGTLLGVLAVDIAAGFDADAEWIAFFEAMAGQAAMAVDAGQLFSELQRTNTELLLAYDTTIEGWSRALDLRDRETEGHTSRVAAMTVTLARAAGISEADIVHIRRGALLHDIGKIGVPDSILHKPGPLSDDEWNVMRGHPGVAHELLSPIAYLDPALDIPFCHHEKWDGTGYPRKLKGEQIPLPARLFAVVDVWDALRSERPYRKALSDRQVIEYITQHAGTHFDPRAVELFLALEEVRS